MLEFKKYQFKRYLSNCGCLTTLFLMLCVCLSCIDVFVFFVLMLKTVTLNQTINHDITVFNYKLIEFIHLSVIHFFLTLIGLN